MKEKKTVSLKQRDLNSRLFDAVESCDFDSIVELIVKGANVNATDENGYTPLYLACYYNSIKIARLLLKKGAIESVNKADNSGRTPLFLACLNDNLELVKSLLEKLLKNGSLESVNKAECNRRTPLHCACGNKNLEIAKLLLENGAIESVNKADSSGETPLHEACFRNDIEMVKLLLEWGAIKSVNKANNGGNPFKLFYYDTPLYLAYFNNNLEMVKLLLEWGADIDQKRLTQIQANFQNLAKQAIAQQILAMLNLTQRFDKWVKGDNREFSLTKKERSFANFLKIAYKGTEE